MARQRKERANLGEQNSGMEADRAERTRGTGVHGDGTAGDEGIDEPMSRTQRDDMSATPNQGDELKEDRSSSSQSQKSQRSERTNKRANDERFDEATEFSGQGNQKEGSDSAEGTGYTSEGSTSEETEGR